MRVLAGDIGGTKTLLAIAEVEGRRVQIVEEKRFASGDHADFVTLTRKFLDQIGEAPSHACFGVAGPVVAGRSELTKLPWVLVESELERELGLARARLINDFVAIAYGTEALDYVDLERLNPGKPAATGNIAVIGAGTGLGEAMIVCVDGKKVVVPSEGGHRDFGARNELEIRFLRWMTEKYDRVSNDRIVSGPGIADIYAFLRDSDDHLESKVLREAIDEAPDPAPVIQRFADEKGDPLCEATLDFFVSIYGSEAGNLALTVVATGGIYIAGGIAPRIVERLKKGTFMRSFASKGRLSAVLRDIPVYVIMNPKVGLLGAALAAVEP